MLQGPTRESAEETAQKEKRAQARRAQPKLSTGSDEAIASLVGPVSKIAPATFRPYGWHMIAVVVATSAPRT